MIWFEYERRASSRPAPNQHHSVVLSDDTEPRPDGTDRHRWASFAEREPSISSQLGVAERSALSEASAAFLRTEIFQKKSG